MALFLKETKVAFYYFIFFYGTYIVLNLLSNFSFFEKEKYHLLQKEINDVEDKINNTKFIDSIAQFKIENRTNTEYDKLENEYIIIQNYDDLDNILFWSNTSILLPKSNLKSKDFHYRYLDGKNYLISERQSGKVRVVIWFDIDKYIAVKMKSSYQFFENKPNKRQEFKILAYNAPKAIEIYSKSGNFIFSILKTNYGHDLWIIFSLLLIAISCILLIRTFYSYAKTIARFYPLIGSIVFFLLIYSLRKTLLYFKYPSILYSLKLFQPSLYSSEITPSLGDLLIFVFTSQLIIFFISRHLNLNLEWMKKYGIATLFHTLCLLFLMGEAFSINKIFDRLVVESSIWFNFDYFPRLNIYSFIGLGVMLMSFSNYYLLSNYIIKLIASFRLKTINIVGSFFFVLFVVMYFAFNSNLKFETKATLFLLFFFLILFYLKFYYQYHQKIINFTLFLIFASFTTTFLLYHYNTKKEEIVLSSIASNISFGIDKKLESELINYFQGKDSSISNKSTIYLQEIDFLEYQNQIQLIDKKIKTNPQLLVFSNHKLKLFFNDNIETKKYIVEISENNQKKYYLVYPKNHLNNSTIKIKNSIQDIAIKDNKTSYALYIHDSLMDYSGFFSYNTKYYYPRKDTVINEVFLNINFIHHISSIPNQGNIIVTTQKENPVSILTQFSYIFCINLMLSIVLIGLSTILNFQNKNIKYFRLRDLRSKIVLAIFLIVICIFSGITYLSFGSFKSKFIDYNREILVNNLKVTQITLDEIINNKSILPSSLDIQKYLENLRNFGTLKFELFDNNGVHIYSTVQDEISSSNQKMISPKVFSEIKRNHLKSLDVSNLIGENSLEVVSSIRDENENIKYIISIASMDNLKSHTDATKLIVVLFNLYVIFFLIAIAFSIWLANRITQPLKLLADKISGINIAKTNEYLEYQYDDEIGELVKRYNLMVDEIEQSAKLLAYKEREEAWSEMAKQIAHEIKNPLTPMKLKIQYLQKKINDGAPNIDKLSANVADTLIEQINNLDNIASSFSNFAKLHQPYIEIIEWIELIKNISSVFENQTTKIRYNFNKIDTAEIRCDRNQMTSCLNNLIKNAIQSYDDKDILIEINLNQNQSYYILSIVDYGKGIDSENITKIFTPNFTTKSSGTGLGLAITKKIVESFDGHIKFESQVNKGTKFTISIPKVISEAIPYSSVEQNWKASGMIELINSEFNTQLIYASTSNIFNKSLYHNFSKPFLHEIAYYKLVKAKEILSKLNPQYQLLILDALRPYEVQEIMWQSLEIEEKNKYIAPPTKDSMHNYGMAIDLWLIQTTEDPNTPNQWLDMGCDFDEFSEKADYHYPHLTESQSENRAILRNVMIQAGFIAYDNEFWHFEAMDKQWARENCQRF